MILSHTLVRTIVAVTAVGALMVSSSNVPGIRAQVVTPAHPAPAASTVTPLPLAHSAKIFVLPLAHAEHVQMLFINTRLATAKPSVHK